MQGSSQRTPPPPFRDEPQDNPAAHLSAKTSASSPRGRRPAAKRGNLWVTAASCALALLTVFVLLDAFVITKVQRTVQEADLSSIVATQDKLTAQTADGSSDTGLSADDDASDNEDATSGLADSGASEGSVESEDAAASGNSDSSESGKAHGPGSHSGTGGHRHKPGSGSGGKGSGTSSSGSSSEKASSIVAGAASAASVGTTIGEYSDENMTINVSKVRAYDTDIYVADIQASSAECLKTALAQNSFGRNLKDTTSNMAEDNGAVLAINGDYYGFRDDGFVLRNGVLYRDAAASGTDALVVYGDGSMAAASQDSTTAQQLKENGAWQVLSFGPVLVSDGAIAVGADEEVARSMGSNPRTAIGMISPLHYVVVVSDGRTDDNAGLSLNELAQVLVDNGATFAYNLDGGGPTTLYFKGEVINNPTSGNIGGERSVSDIVYFG